MLKLFSEEFTIWEYLISGRRPWSYGYNAYKHREIRRTLANQALLDIFLNNQPLPEKYGFRIDERVIEYPWLFSRLGVKEGILLDAGSALNHKYILESPSLKNKTIVIYNLTPENNFKRSNISYIFGDLRNTILKSESFDEIVCISTLEHIGMNNAFLYSKDYRYNESSPDEYKKTIDEFRRLLKPSGKLFVTVPYGRYQNLGWLQQFDSKCIEIIIKTFKGSSSKVSYFKYFNDGWQNVNSESCVNCTYFNIHSSRDYESDYVAAARAVACIELVK